MLCPRWLDWKFRQEMMDEDTDFSWLFAIEVHVGKRVETGNMLRC